jgi:hypothetical protein
MHCVTSLKTVSAKPGGIKAEAHVWAKTRHPAASIQSFERSDNGIPFSLILAVSLLFLGLPE